MIRKFAGKFGGWYLLSGMGLRLFVGGGVSSGPGLDLRPFVLLGCIAVDRISLDSFFLLFKFDDERVEPAGPCEVLEGEKGGAADGDEDDEQELRDDGCHHGEESGAEHGAGHESDEYCWGLAAVVVFAHCSAPVVIRSARAW